MSYWQKSNLQQSLPKLKLLRQAKTNQQNNTAVLEMIAGDP